MTHFHYHSPTSTRNGLFALLIVGTSIFAAGLVVAAYFTAWS